MTFKRIRLVGNKVQSAKYGHSGLSGIRGNSQNQYLPILHRTGKNRHQIVLIPTDPDSVIGADNPVRLIDVFPGALDMDIYGFTHVKPKKKKRSTSSPKKYFWKKNHLRKCIYVGSMRDAKMD